MALLHASSGNIYENFKCVKVGQYELPSSMDLRKHLEEIQIYASPSLDSKYGEG